MWNDRIDRTEPEPPSALGTILDRLSTPKVQTYPQTHDVLGPEEPWGDSPLGRSSQADVWSNRGAEVSNSIR